MSMPIQRQSESYNVFDTGTRFAKDYESHDLPAGLVGLMGGPRIQAGLNNRRHADAYAVPASGMGSYDPYGGPSVDNYAHPSEPDGYDDDMRQREELGLDREAPDEGRYADPHDFREHEQAPDYPLDPHEGGESPYMTPETMDEMDQDYGPQSFNAARHLTADDGPAMFTPMMYQPGQEMMKHPHSMMYGLDGVPEEMGGPGGPM